MSQYGVPTQFGLMDIDENNGGHQYMSPGVIDIDEPASNGGTFFLLFDLSWVVALVGATILLVA